jgi:arylsulfatase A-like enzyme
MGAVMDLYPTILALAGVPDAPGHVIDGFDLKAQLAGRRNDSRSETFLSHVPQEHRSSYFSSLVSGDWKVICHYFVGDDAAVPAKGKKAAKKAAKQAALKGPEARYELFDLGNDPFEATNLAEKNPEKLQAMMRALAGELSDKGALYPVRDGEEVKPLIP